MKPHACLILFFLFALLTVAPATEGNIQRAFFMRFMELALDPMPELDSRANVDKAIKRMKEAISVGSQIDPDFLKWVEPGLPAAFSKLMLALSLRAKGLETDSLELQLKGQRPWLEWGEYWRANDTKIYKKLKVE